MKIAILANRGNIWGNKREERIDSALEKLGHKVIPFHLKEEGVLDKILNSGADMFLFYGIDNAIHLEETLKKFKKYKVCISWDKVWMGRQELVYKLAPLTDLIFLSDGDFVRSHNFINIYELEPATDINNDKAFGTFREEYQIPIVFPGAVYGTRQNVVNSLQSKYGDNFRVVHSVFNEDFVDLCESAKVFISPLFPQTDFYWANRVYNVISAGGFIIMPKLEGLTRQFKEGEHIEYYRSFEELCQKIDYYLEHKEERDKIRKAGQKHCLENYTYEKALKKMFKLL